LRLLEKPGSDRIKAVLGAGVAFGLQEKGRKQVAKASD